VSCHVDGICSENDSCRRTDVVCSTDRCIDSKWTSKAILESKIGLGVSSKSSLVEQRSMTVSLRLSHRFVMVKVVLECCAIRERKTSTAVLRGGTVE
jgi:hypothetical protein